MVRNLSSHKGRPDRPERSTATKGLSPDNIAMTNPIVNQTGDIRIKVMTQANRSATFTARQNKGRSVDGSDVVHTPVGGAVVSGETTASGYMESETW